MKSSATAGESMRESPGSGDELFENPRRRRFGLDYRGAADLTSLSVSLLQKLVSRDEIPHVKVGHRVVFIQEQLEAWLTTRPKSKSGRKRKETTHV